MASSLLFFSLLLFNLQVSMAGSNIAFEDGYTVSTVIDGHEFQINPRSILPQFGSSDLIILDSANNAFYTVSFSKSQEIAVKRLSGGNLGFLDGDLATAKFNNPRSFAVDLNGNVYVADKGNLAVRKISKSGVTTIAGGDSTAGRVDGPGRNASFSTDFELAFVPERCALMICDHGNYVVRQINLKPQDCERGPQPVRSMAAWAWALVLGVSCLLSLIIGFVVRPYVTRHTGRFQPISSQQDMEAFPNQSGEASTDALLRHQKRTYSEILGSEVITTKSQLFAEQLKDLNLITFDGEEESPNPADKTFKLGDDNEHGNDVLCDDHQRIDNMINDNIVGFVEQAKKVQLDESFVSSSGLVKRR
ncbi:hypothetical protein LOK49_LG10G00421 [Camellia lanceoleosa]|uniref:Uncharacterized protein n=1 Tax=Camellia lanceoleosa TaxID=1840588 RepID=A0ACC0GDM5_9ERIC|nr:hypothetical protein LOK49_LG10G00421 [Camellia lanceoleosa]